MCVSLLGYQFHNLLNWGWFSELPTSSVIWWLLNDLVLECFLYASWIGNLAWLKSCFHWQYDTFLILNPDLTLASLVAQMVKNLPVMRETQVQSLGGEDALEEGMATHSSIVAQRIPWTEEPGRLQSLGSQRVGHDWATKHSTQTWPS